MTAVTLFLAACNSPEKPLPDGLLGEWEIWCRTDREGASTCLGREEPVVHDRFLPDGTIVSGLGNLEDSGTWTLFGDELTIVLEGGGTREVQRTRARIIGSNLVLWNVDSGYGTVLGRSGAAFEATPGAVSTGGATAHTIGGVSYTLELPAGYHLVRDDNARQTWMSPGDGLAIELVLSPRPQSDVGGKRVTPPCDGSDGGVLGSREPIGGVDRDTSIGTSWCVGDDALHCAAVHSRGWLEPQDEEQGLALCRTIVVKGR